MIYISIFSVGAKCQRINTGYGESLLNLFHELSLQYNLGKETQIP